MKRILKNMGYIRISAHYHPKTGPFQHDPTVTTSRGLRARSEFTSSAHSGLDPGLKAWTHPSTTSQGKAVAVAGGFFGNDTPSTYVDTKVVLIFRKRFYVFFSRHFLGEERKNHPPPDNWPEDSQRSCLQVSGLQ